MKKGIALFSTLMILVLVIMLMSVALKNSTNIKKSILQDRYLIQENLTITDTLKLVDTQIADKLNNEKLENRIEIQKILFSTPLLIKDSVTNSSIEVILKSIDGKLNINLINNNNNSIKSYITRVFEKIGVQEPMILQEILLANITNSDEYRDDYKIHLKQLDKTFGRIDSYNEFEEMLLLYVKNTDDQDALKIEFEKYFTFYVEIESNGSPKTYIASDDCKIDINYAELEVIDAIIDLPNSIRQAIKEKKSIYSLPFDEDTSSIVKNTLEGLQTNNILLKINTTSINNKVSYTINYNLKTKKISKISMDRWIY